MFFKSSSNLFNIRSIYLDDLDALILLKLNIDQNIFRYGFYGFCKGGNSLFLKGGVETNTRIEIDDSGLVKIAAVSQEDGEAALKMIKEITVEPEVGAVYEGTVVKIMDFGAFVQILPNVDGLVHISQLAAHRVNKVSDIVKEGDQIKVKVLEISKDGKIRLSYKAALEEER